MITDINGKRNICFKNHREDKKNTIISNILAIDVIRCPVRESSPPSCYMEYLKLTSTVYYLAL